LHTVLGDGGRAKQNANQQGGSRNSNCRASAGHHGCTSLKSESGLPPCRDDPPIALVTSNEKFPLDRKCDPLEMTRVGTDEALKTKHGGTRCNEVPHKNKQARSTSSEPVGEHDFWGLTCPSSCRRPSSCRPCPWHPSSCRRLSSCRPWTCCPSSCRHPSSCHRRRRQRGQAPG
jgi:hypothetical protein